MSPANIEGTLKGASMLVGQAFVVGDRRPYNVALLVLDPDASAAYATAHGLPDASPAALCRDPGVHAVVAAAVELANSRLSRSEQVKRFTILPVDWLPAGDELTPTMKTQATPDRTQVRRGDRSALRAGARGRGLSRGIIRDSAVLRSPPVPPAETPEARGVGTRRPARTILDGGGLGSSRRRRRDAGSSGRT